ncbi:MAG: bifunctional glycosyltransferase/class I SAM-dependent methyltransferase [Acidobacteriia bacterium]|nr:bifunctional glycosyltransferase/class I SAM-dependent methyltransferase [Terriglobia bacterium]
MVTDQQSIADKALEVLETQHVAIHVVAYNAGRSIGKVLSRIPHWVAEKLAEIYVIDDCSGDDTIAAATTVSWSRNFAPLRIFKTPFYQGYGGNQKIGFSYAIDREFDIVIHLHGDGKYAPEALPEILAPYADGADAVFGSRFLFGGSPLRDGMPLYKFLGNRFLSALQNVGLGAQLSEWHCGYRSYRTALLKKIPYSNNSSDYDFDTEIIIQVLAAGHKIIEVPVPTYYGKEIRRINAIRCGLKSLGCTLHFCLMKLELFYDPKFDLVPKEDAYRYTRKEAPTTLQHYIRTIANPGKRALDVGGGDGRAIAKDWVARGCHVTCIDQFVPQEGNASEHVRVDLDLPLEHQLFRRDFDTVLAIDVIEHLKRPEDALKDIAQKMTTGGILYASTGNVSFLPLRLLLLLGFFNYGRRGILDHTHARLFTVGSFRRLLHHCGFEVLELHAFGPPIRDLIGNDSFLLRASDTVLFWCARLFPRLFGYQILVVARKTPVLRDLVEETISLASPTDGHPCCSVHDDIPSAGSVASRTSGPAGKPS